MARIIDCVAFAIYSFHINLNFVEVSMTATFILSDFVDC